MDRLEKKIAKYKKLSNFELFLKYIFINGLSYGDLDFSSKAVQRFVVPENGLTREEITETLKKFAYAAEFNISVPTSSLIPEGRTVYIRQFPRYLGDPMHNHCDAMEINIVLQGELIHILDENVISLGTGDICFIAPDVSHITRTYGDDSVVLTILIHRDRINAVFNDIKESDSILISFLKKIIYGRTFLPFIVCRTGFDKDIAGLIIDLTERQDIDNPLIDQFLLRGVELFILQLLINHNDSFSKGTAIDKKYADIQNLLDYIRFNVNTVSLDSLSETFHYTPNYLSALIKEQYGKNFKDIVSDIKLQNAAEMLKNSEYNISHIAELAGYSDKCYFHRVFKKKYGMTPAEYRTDDLLSL